MAPPVLATHGVAFLRRRRAGLMGRTGSDRPHPLPLGGCGDPWFRVAGRDHNRQPCLRELGESHGGRRSRGRALLVKAIRAVLGVVLPEREQPCGQFTEENTPGWRPSPYSSPHFQARTAKPPRRGMHSPPMPASKPPCVATARSWPTAPAGDGRTQCDSMGCSTRPGRLPPVGSGLPARRQLASLPSCHRPGRTGPGPLAARPGRF